MPHLRFRGLKEEKLIEASTELREKLSLVMNCAKDSFTIEYIPSVYIGDGVISENNHIFAEMLWFSRDDETKQKVADVLTDVLSKESNQELAVYFIDMKKENYFKNGVHF